MGHLILIGFMGAGKTRVGEDLARRLRLPFIDTDTRVEKSAGMSVADIFRRRGEEGFREVEGGVIDGLGKERPSVVSCGGGAVLRPSNRETLRRLGSVFYLKVPPSDVLERLEGDDGRPLLAGPAGRGERVERLLEEREPAYLETADHVIETGGRKPGEVAGEIERLWRGSG